MLPSPATRWRARASWSHPSAGGQCSQAAHAAAKRALFDDIARRTGTRLDANVFTIGFARRATAYKRADLVFGDVERLARIAETVGPLQMVFGGKAHPRDAGGKELITRIHDAMRALQGRLTVLYLEGYEMELAAKLEIIS